MDLVQTLLGETPGEAQPLLDAGLDSLSTGELRNVLAAVTGIAMPATVIFDYPSVLDLATYITSVVPAPVVVSKIDAALPHRWDSVNSLRALDVASFPECRSAPPATAMFVASTAGLTPGASGDSRGGDGISRTPMARWHLDDCALDGGAKPHFGAFVAGVECFDARTFDISAPELVLMDAQQRLLLISSTESLRSAGIFEINSKVPVGVYVGISSMDHQKLLDRRQSVLSTFTATGGALSVAAGRISFAHGLTGAAVAVDTACSSSLVGWREKPPFKRLTLL